MTVHARRAKLREIAKVLLLVALMDTVGTLAAIMIIVVTPKHPVYVVPISAGTYSTSCPTAPPTVAAVVAR